MLLIPRFFNNAWNRPGSMIFFCFFILFQLRYRHAKHSTIDKKQGNYILINTVWNTECQTCWGNIDNSEKQDSYTLEIFLAPLFYHFRLMEEPGNFCNTFEKICNHLAFVVCPLVKHYTFQPSLFIPLNIYNRYFPGIVYGRYRMNKFFFDCNMAKTF